MKKRLLALALCLVMMTSLLPITAAATETRTFTSLYMQGEVTESDKHTYYVQLDVSKLFQKDGKVEFDSIYSYEITTDQLGTSPLTTPPVEGKKYYVTFMKKGDPEDKFSVEWDESFSANLVIPGYKTEFIKASDTIYSSGEPALWFYFSLTKEHEHLWQFTQKENTLTATCKNCDTPPVTLSLFAHSVTLPDSPFNAQLAGKEQFETATGAVISKIRYDYKGSDGVWHKGVDPVAANAKAGEYQAFVEISNLPRPVESDGVVAMAENPDGTYTAELFVKYTAVDPAVTAQTGDNRPIELMMAGVVVFSALAAAAFLLDNKRRSYQ